MPFCSGVNVHHWTFPPAVTHWGVSLTSRGKASLQVQPGGQSMAWLWPNP